MTERIEQWMHDNGVKRIVRFATESGGWGVYLAVDKETFGTGATLADALADAEARA